MIGIVLLAVSGITPVAGHDIGVSQAELIQLDNERYTLSVQAGLAVGYLFPSPQLPEQCQYADNPRGTQGPGGKRFEFTCAGGLTAGDTIELAWRRDGAMLTATWLDGTEAKRLFRNEAGTIFVPLAELQAGSGSWVSAAKRYTGLGVEHILLGIDHLLFVLALLLIVQGPWMLVKTITAFTLAHSITLGLATLGFVNVPPRPVEAAIALSIVFLCVEIVHAHQGRVGVTYRYPWVVAFAFGLLHGLGFAGALSEIGLPPSEIPLALLFFNIGVEVGQLMFVAAVLVLAWVIKQIQLAGDVWTRVVPAYGIGTLATYWFMQRLAVIFAAV